MDVKKFINDLLSKYGVTNIAGTITMVTAAIIYYADTYLGCNLGAMIAATGISVSPTCNLPSWFPATWVPITMGIAASVVFVAKLFRPGTFLRNFFGGTAVIVPPDSKASGDGTVTAKQVEATK